MLPYLITPSHLHCKGQKSSLTTKNVETWRPQKKAQQNGKQVDVYAIVTERIIAQLEKGAIPWRKPWSDTGLPRNLFSKKLYRGINFILLALLSYERNLFVTFNQLKEIGGKVKKMKRHVPTIGAWESNEHTPSKNTLIRKRNLGII